MYKYENRFDAMGRFAAYLLIGTACMSHCAIEAGRVRPRSIGQVRALTVDDRIMRKKRQHPATY